MQLATGVKAPAWTGKDQNAHEHSSKDYAGRWTLLYFYPKDDTPGCTTQACGFRDDYSRLKDNVTIIGVSGDDAASHKAFADKYSLPFTLIADPDKTIIAAFGTDNTTFKKRTSFLIDPHGTIAKIYENIDCAKHSKDIIADIGRLQAR